MGDVAIISRPVTEGTRQALVLTEDRLGHYPEFRTFFVRTFDLDVPVVLVTGNPSVETAIKAIEHGALRYLVKPVPPQQLFDVVSRAVRWHRLAVIRREAAEKLLPGNFVGLRFREIAGYDFLS